MWIGYLLFAIIYTISVYIIYKKMNELNKELDGEIHKNVEYKMNIKELKKIVRDLSGKQYCGNKDICLRIIENKLNLMD